MIKKVIEILYGEQDANDRVFLSWFDRQRPNLIAISEKGKRFIAKSHDSRLNENDVLITEDGYKIAVKIQKDDVFIFKFQDASNFAKCAYEIGNRHQPIYIGDMSVTALNDTAILDIVDKFRKIPNITVSKAKKYFESNVLSSHPH